MGTERPEGVRRRGRWTLAGASLSAATLAFAAAIHCGQSGTSQFGNGASDDPCATVLAGQCGAVCTSDSECGQGTHCGTDGRCTAQCAPAGSSCSVGTCSPRGRCTANGEDPGGGQVLGGGDTGGASNGTSLGADACASVDVNVGPQTLTMVVLVDQSGSMNASFGDAGTRWNVLRDVLIGDTGVITQLSGDVRFGVTLYSNSPQNPPSPPATDPVCPDLVNVAPAFDNLSNIRAVYNPNDTKPNTPTGESLLAVAGLTDAGVAIEGGLAATDTGGPKVILLATDGDPDTCADRNANDVSDPARQNAAKEFVLDAVRKVYGAGVKVYVLGIGDQISEDHQRHVANLGVGQDPDGGDASFYRPSTREGLVSDIRGIVRGERPCAFSLDGQVRDPNLGTVTLSGRPLTFPTEWRLKSESEFELVGSACAEFRAADSATLQVRFACGGFERIR